VGSLAALGISARGSDAAENASSSNPGGPTGQVPRYASRFRLDYSSVKISKNNLELSSRVRASPRAHQARFWLDALAGPSRGILGFGAGANQNQGPSARAPSPSSIARRSGWQICRKRAFTTDVANR